MVRFKIFIIAVLLHACRAELDQAEINSRLNSLGVDPEQGGEVVEKGKKAFEDQCRKYGGEDAVERSKMAQEDMVKCVLNLVNITQVQQEMQAARPKGELDEVFKKYCLKSPQLMDCVSNLTHNVQPCLAEDQQRVTTILQDVAKALLNFTCFGEGERITLFVAEGGPECLESKSSEVQQCISTTFSKYSEHFSGLDGNLTDINKLNLPIFLFNEAQCNDIDEVFQCAESALETCEDPTPANVMESIFKVIRKVIPCAANKGEPNVQRAGIAGSSNSAMSLYMMESIFKVIRKVIPCAANKGEPNVQRAGVAGSSNSAMSLYISLTSLLGALLVARF